MVEFLLILGVLTIYFAPTFVAAWRRHPRSVAIGLVNLLLGFTVLGWIAALFWAMSRDVAAAHKYDYYSEQYGGMQVSSKENMNNAVLWGISGLIAVATVFAVGAHHLRARESKAPSQVGVALNAPTSPAAATDKLVQVPVSSSAQASTPQDAVGQSSRSAGQVDAKPELPAGVHEDAATGESERPTKPIVAPSAHIHFVHHSRIDPNKLYVDGVPPAERIAPRAVAGK